MGDYALAQSQPAGGSRYGGGSTGGTFPRVAMLTTVVGGSDYGTAGVTYGTGTIRYDISGSGTAYFRVFGSVTITASAPNGNIGLAIYKNGVQVSTGAYSQYLGGSFNQPFPLAIQTVVSATAADNIQLYFIAPGTVNISISSDAVLGLHQMGGSGRSVSTSLNSCSPQWAQWRLSTGDSGSTLSTAEVDFINYLPSSLFSTTRDAFPIASPYQINKIGAYLISVFVNLKSIAATAQIVTIRLKVDAVTIITRQVQLPTAANGYFSGAIEHIYNKTGTGAQNFQVTLQSNVVNNYIVAQGSSFTVKLVRRNEV